MIIKGHSCAVIRGTDRFLTPCHCGISTSPAQRLASAPVLPRLWLPASLYLPRPWGRTSRIHAVVRRWHSGSDSPWFSLNSPTSRLKP